MATNNKINSVVTKPSVYPFNKLQARPTSRASLSQSHGLPWEMTALEARDPKIVSYEESINPNWSKEERLMFELKSGHFTVEEGDPWTQAEVNAAWTRINTPTAVSQEPEYHRVDEEVDEQDLTSVCI